MDVTQVMGVLLIIVVRVTIIAPNCHAAYFQFDLYRIEDCWIVS